MTEKSQLTRDTVGRQPQDRSGADAESSTIEDVKPTVTDRASFAVSVRVILLLATICWALIAAAVVWLIS